jgi:hypothetical protein
MPIEYRIDHDRRVVIAVGKGALTSEDFFGYKREAWTQAGVPGYDELMDLTLVTEIVDPSVEEIRKLVRLAASMDPPETPSRFAIAAPKEILFGLGRMYEAYRSLEPGSTKTVTVFRTLPEAMAFLGLEEL